MTRNLRLAAWGSAVLAVALAIAFGPLFAGYVLAGAAFAVIVALMAMRVGRAIGHWRLEHPWRFRRAGTRSRSGARGARPAA